MMDESNFHGGCPHCGYGAPATIEKGATCPFCENVVSREVESVEKQEDAAPARSLESAVARLRELVAEEALRVGGAAIGNRDVIVVRVLAEHPEIRDAIESAADAELFRKAAAAAVGPSWIRSGVESEVRKLAEDVRSARPELSDAAARAEVWRSRPDLLHAYHRPGAELPGIESVAIIAKDAVRRGVDEALRDLAGVLAPDDPALGHALVAKRFPRLFARWTRGVR